MKLVRGAAENLTVLEKSVEPFFVVLIFFLFSVSFSGLLRRPGIGG